MKYLAHVLCLCLSLAAVVPSIRAEDTNKDYVKSLSHYIMGVYHADLDEIDLAIQEYRQALKADVQSYLLHLNLASAYINKDESLAAIAELKQAIALAPEAVEPHALLALVYAARNNLDAATEEYALALKSASKLEPKNIEIYKNLGLVYLQQKKFREAEGIYKLISDIAPLDAQAHFFLASVYYELKNNPGTEKELKTALRLKPDDHEALNFLGYFYLEQDKNIDQAGALIKKALKFEPENGAYLDSLGWFYYKKGRFKEALDKLEKAASLISDPAIYDHLGDCFLKLGNRESAKINWNKSLKLDSEQEKIKDKLLKISHEQ